MSLWGFNLGQLSYQFRIFLAFVIGFLFLLTMLTAFIIIPQLGYFLGKQHLKDLETNLALETEIFKQFIGEQKKTLDDIAKFPVVMNSVMLSSSPSMDLVDLFEHTLIASEKSQLILQNINGDILLKRTDDVHGFYGAEEKWFIDLLQGKRDFHFQLLYQQQDKFTFHLAVPVKYRNSSEGVLSAEITVPLRRVFYTDLFKENVGFKLTQGDVVISTPYEHIVKPYATTKIITNPDIKYTYITDYEPIEKTERKLRNLILWMMLCGLLVSFILFCLLTYSAYTNKSNSPKPSFNETYLFPIIIGMIGIAATASGYHLFKDQEQQTIQDETLYHAKKMIQSLEHAIEDKMSALDFISIFYAASQHVDRAEFKTVVQPILNKQKSFLSIKWLPYVIHKDRKLKEDLARVDGIRNFEFHTRDSNGAKVTAKKKDNYFPVYYVEPIDSNKKMLGRDYASDEEYYQILRMSEKKGEKIATKPVDMKLNNDTKKGFLIFSPVFKCDKNNFFSDEGVKKLKGFLVAEVQIDHVINSLSKENDNRFSIDISDVTSDETIPIYNQEKQDITFQYEQEIDISGRRWKIKISTLDPLSDSESFWWPIFILMLGIVFSTTISLMLMQQIRRRDTVEKEVKIKTSELQSSESRLRNIFVSAVDGIFIVNYDGNIESLNPASRKMFGYTCSEAVGQSLRSLIPDFDIRNPIQKKIVNNSDSYYGLRKNGEKFPIDISLSSFKVSDRKLYSMVTRDITDRKEAEEKITESLKFQDLIKESNPDLIFVKDENFRIIDCNQAFLHMYPESTRGDVIGKTTFEKYKKNEMEAFLSMDKKAFKEGNVQYDETITFPNGEMRTLFTQKIRFENNKKEPFILCIARDITDREKLTKKLMQSNEELLRFAYICSHDLQEPIRMMASFAEKLEMRIGNTIESDKKAKQYFHFIKSGAERARNLIADILSYSKIDNETAKREIVDLNELLGQIKENILAMDDSRENKSIISIEPGLPTIIGNKAQFLQLFQNLIQNGIKYQDMHCQPTIHISCTELERVWKFSISDNGIGIESRHHDKIFDVFQRLHRTTEYSGTGIGLSICKKVVESYGGEIYVDSEPHKGATFYFTLRKEAVA